VENRRATMAISSMLVPVSTFDERDVGVLQYACGLWVQSVRRLLVATAVESEGIEAPVIPAEMDRARQRLATMGEAVKGCPMEIEWRVVSGDKLQAVLALAQQADVDVICCGTEGKSVVDYLFSGSVSEDIVSSGNVRTMTVRYSLLDAAGDPRKLAVDFARRLVVPTDFSASASRAFLSALDRPAQNLDTLHVIHVLSENPTDNERFEAETMLQGLQAIAREHGVECVAEIRSAPTPDEEVLAYLEDVGATGVITGRKGKGRLSKAVLGALSMRLLRDAPCPVVVQP
jgi:nucleotide-binding universal stress UspA family protein